MLVKQVQFLSSEAGAIRARGVFTDSFEKVAFGALSDDWATAEEIRAYIKTITPEDRKKYCYVLVNALGAGEYFGSNINADYFPWNALCHEGDDYGYKTFLKAHAYAHHVNKDPTRAFGVPVLSVLNHTMKRVELIIRLDREKAKTEGQDGIIKRIDAGEFPDVSMGCKVPYDVCSICGNKSKTRSDYCEHMNPPPDKRGVYGPNKILPDGRKIYVINTLPRFFDISFVFIGADKTAKVMAKLASVGDLLCLGDVCAIPRRSVEVQDLSGSLLIPDRIGSMAKTASAEIETGSCCSSCADFDKLAEAFGAKPKIASHRKLSEIIKSVPVSPFAMKTLPKIEAAEPDISATDLKRLGERFPVPDVLGSSLAGGVILKPHEFMRITLVRMGENQLADDLQASGRVFRQVQGSDQPMEVRTEAVLKEVIELLQGLLPERTAFGDRFKIRTMKSEEGKKNLPTRQEVSDPLLDKISAAYNGYRRAALVKVSQAVEVVRSDPRLREMVLGHSLASVFSKTASNEHLLSQDSMAYFVGAHLRDRRLLATTAVAIETAATSELQVEL